jgi:hypothetical protein
MPVLLSKLVIKNNDDIETCSYDPPAEQDCVVLSKTDDDVWRSGGIYPPILNLDTR